MTGERLVVGCMSGTSCDAVDAALVEWPDGDSVRDFSLLAFEERPHPPELQAAIHRLAAGELGRQSEEEGDLTVIEGSTLDLAHHQHPKHLAVLDDRHAEKPPVVRLTRFGNAQVTRVRRCILEVEWFGALGHQPDESTSERPVYLRD